MDSTNNNDSRKQSEPNNNTINPFPAFKNLPLRPEYPPHVAWGVWGENDELGTVVSSLPFLVTERY